MKHLSKQPISSLPSYTPKPTTTTSSTTRRTLSRPSTPLAHRLLLVLLGALIASTIFLLHPYLHPPLNTTTTTTNPTSQPHFHRHFQHLPTIQTHLSGGARRVPVGLKRPSKRVVVTGGAGFVGSHLVDRLLERGDSVIVVDNFFTGRKENLVHHFGDPRFELIRHDVVEPILLEVDQIYHLACPASPVHYKYNPIKTIISFDLLF